MLKPELCFTNTVSGLKQPTANCVYLVLHELLHQQFQIMDNNYSGRVLQTELETALKWINGHVRADLAQWPKAADRCQLVFFVDATDAIVIELKRIRSSTIVYSSLRPGHLIWHPSNTQHEDWTSG
jgi:hypothetical protein